MTLAESDIRAIVDRITDDGASVDGAGQRTVQLRVVEPLLEVLGWDLRGPDVVPDVEVGPLRVDYVLQIDAQPAIVVLVRAADSGPVPPEGSGLDSLLRSGPVDWAIDTDGSAFRFATVADEEVHTRRFEIADLPDHVDVLESYTRGAARERHRRSDRSAALDRLAENRDDAIERVATALEGVAGEAIVPVAEETAREVVDEILDARAAGTGQSVSEASPTADAPADRSRREAIESTPREPLGTESTPASDASEPGATVRAPHEAAGAVDEGEVDERSVDAGTVDEGVVDEAAGDEEEPNVGEADETEGDEKEYVIRFFSGGSSVGAVGTQSPADTLAGATRYCYENHGLSRAVRLPWNGPLEGPVLASDPPGTEWIRIGTDHGDPVFVRPIDDADAVAEAIEALADLAGLRVMFQGDW